MVVGAGMGQAMDNYFKMSGCRIPYTMVRGMSDWLHQPVIYDPVQQLWTYPGEVPDTEFDYGYK